MMPKLNPYPSYRASKVKWLDSIPQHWGMRRLKSICLESALYGANVSASSYSAMGVRFLRTTDITESGRLKPGGVFLPEELVRDYVLVDGDLLISRSGTVGRSFLFDSGRHGRCAYAGYLVRFVPNREVHPTYLFWFTKTQPFSEFVRLMAISSTIDNVNGEKFANLPLPLPPLAEQSEIVRFLDHADRRIRRYLRAKQRLIALLEEQKRAIIHHAVTGQSNAQSGQPYAAYKQSGIEWLREVPQHWRERSLSTVASSIQTGPFGSQLHAGEYVHGGVPVINPSHMRSGTIVPDPAVSTSKFLSGNLGSGEASKQETLWGMYRTCGDQGSGRDERGFDTPGMHFHS